MTAPVETAGLNGRCFPCACGSCGRCYGGTCTHEHLPRRPMDVDTSEEKR